VDRVGGHVGDAGEEALVGEVDEREDLFGVDVGCIYVNSAKLEASQVNVRWYLVLLTTSPKSSTK
jgi:hypothetical protein